MAATVTAPAASYAVAVVLDDRVVPGLAVPGEGGQGELGGGGVVVPPTAARDAGSRRPGRTAGG
ncbi:hypothetical protein ACIHCM_11065 [Streptomyces sp. NPDC052023]|uniref:hypothetical protein n=1 Tax=Streptomyces sp. NPDC052023 TaxID=3365681 RepID=UPI0037D611CF